jgi:cellulose synthase/poly-beta-1,6-N-acetylglucosamine synthase-like glycosyltransferase
MTEVLSIAGGVAGLLITLPGGLELLLTTTGAIRKRRRPLFVGSRKCRLAVVIPAHNEELLVARCVESTRASATSVADCEIAVVADNCTDETSARASEAGARVLVRQDPEHRGKGYALRFAFDLLSAEGFDAFLVIDADSVVSPNLISEVIRYFGAGAAALQCRYRVANDEASVRTRLMDVAFLAFNVVRPRGRSAWGLSAGLLGNGFALHRETLLRVPYTADSIVEDLEYHLRLAAASERIDFIDDATVFGEMPERSNAAREQRSRWEGGRLRMIKEWTPRLASGVLRGNWRFLEPLLDLLTLPLAFYVLTVLLSLFSPVRLLRDYAAVSLALVIVHVLFGAFLGGRPLKSTLALAAAPFYILWKLTTLDAILSTSRKDAQWVRSSRKTEATKVGAPT